MRTILPVVVLAFAGPIAALADLSGNVLLQTNTALSLDTGAVASNDVQVTSPLLHG